MKLCPSRALAALKLQRLDRELISPLVVPAVILALLAWSLA